MSSSDIRSESLITALMHLVAGKGPPDLDPFTHRTDDVRDRLFPFR
jgi:hypothetical protein